MILHPALASGERQKLFQEFYGSDKVYRRSQMSGFLDDLFDTAWNAVVGLADALSGAITAVVNTIKKIGETISLIVRAAIGDVKWSEVLDSVGEIFQEIGAVVYYLHPYRIAYEWLKQSPLTAHAFNELDKFTGGMLTSAVNVSTLPWRAMRGDPISKEELIRDALFVIQVAAVVFTGPVGLGVMVGTMVGREVCSKQTEARDACMVAFQIAGAAAGSWASSVTGVTWGTAAEQAAEGFTDAEMNAWLQGDAAYAEFLARETALASTSISSHLSVAAQDYMTRAGIDVISQGAIRLCQSQDWVGNRECEIIGDIASNYVKAPAGEAWEDFLAREVARIGEEELMLQWFPENSKERRAIQRAWQIKYVDVPVDQTVVVKQNNKGLWFLLAAGVATLAAGGLA